MKQRRRSARYHLADRARSETRSHTSAAGQLQEATNLSNCGAVKFVQLKRLGPDGLHVERRSLGHMPVPTAPRIAAKLSAERHRSGCWPGYTASGASARLIATVASRERPLDCGTSVAPSPGSGSGSTGSAGGRGASCEHHRASCSWVSCQQNGESPLRSQARNGAPSARRPLPWYRLRIQWRGFASRGQTEQCLPPFFRLTELLSTATGRAMHRAANAR